MNTLLLALALFVAALALAAPGIAQSEVRGSGGSTSEEGYPDATPAESKQIFERESEPTIEGIDEQAQPLADENVLEYRGDHIALVAPSNDYESQTPQGEPVPGMFEAEKAATPTEAGDQTPALVLSDTPLRARGESGVKRPLDLTIEQAQGSFRAANPLVDFEASPDPVAGVSIGRGAERVTIAAAAATQAAPQGSRVSDLGVFYPEVALDTDLFVSPTPGGLEIFTQLRSPQAPERIKLAVELPAGAQLLATAEGGARIVEGGEQVGLVSAPSALDAVGAAVEVSMAVEGDSLVLTAFHRDEPVSYPVLVDPVIDVFDTWGAAQQLPWRRVPADSGMPDSNPRWYTKKRNPGDACWQPGTCWQNGLYVYGKSGVFFPLNSYAGFTYSPPRYVPYGPGLAPDPGFPGTSAWIHRVVFDPVQYRLNGDSANSSSSAPRLKLGIFEDKGNSVAPRGIGYPNGNSPITKDNSYYGELNGPLNAYNTGDGTISGDPNGGDRRGKQVWFQLATHVERTTQALHEAYLGGAEIRLLDGEAPSASADDPDNNNATVQTPWLKSTANRSITITGNDKASNLDYGGLGIKSLSAQIFKPDAQSASGVLTPLNQIDCDGSHAKPCQVQASRPITYPTSQLPNGISYGWGYAYDALDKNQGLFGIGAWYIKVDREAPTQPTVSGPLLSAADPGNDVVVQASDPGGAGRDLGSAADRAAWRSGVAKIELFVDGAATPADSESFTCGQTLETCRQSESATLNPEGASEGDHTCKFVVSDAAGNASQLIKPCYIDRSPPETTITSGPSGLTNNKSPSFAYTSSRSSSTFTCRLDGPGLSATTLPVGVEEGCTPSPKTYGPLADGYYKFSVKAKRKGLEDQTPAIREFRVDATPPETTITSGPSGLTSDPTPEFGFSSSEASSTFQCRTYPGPVDPNSAAAFGSCSPPHTTAQLSDGQHTFEVKAKDPAGNEDPTPAPRSFTIDSTRPETTITSGPSGRTRNVTPIFSFESSEAASTFQCRMDAEPFESCESPKLTGPFLDGEHTFAVKATDPAGNEDLTPATRTFTIDSTLGDSPEPDKLGLEQYFHYDSTETGLAGAHVNLATGNLVWHRVPMVNPGRGLASFLNLTYNSYGYPLGGDLPPIEDNRFDAEYDEFGIGFSASISGITRMNEPLGGAIKLAAPVPTVPNEIALNDPDGTRHVFTLNESESTGVPEDLQDQVDPANLALVYDAPPGVDLRLRTFSSASGDAANGDVLPEQREKFWAMTRPDGVTYFFDGWGFLRSIEDRDGNELRYVYDHVVPATGNDCTELLEPIPGGTTVAEAGCEPRLAKVVDAAGNDGTAPAAERTVAIDYFDAADLSLDRDRLLDPAYLNGLANGALHRLGKVQKVTDHAGRNLQFIYDDRGFLESFSESAGVEEAADQRRETQFEYSDDQGDLTDWPQLSKVTDPRGSSTTITYKPNNYLPSTTNPLEDIGGERPKRRVATITNRAGNTRTFTYGEPDASGKDTETEADQEDADSESLTLVRDGRGEIWRNKLDGGDRPIELTDPLGIRTDLTWSSEDDGDGAGFLDNGNRVLSQTAAASNPDEDAKTAFTYNANGQLLTQTDPEGRTTTLTYCDHPGVYRAEGVASGTNPPATEGVDQDGSFVSDLTAMERPRAGSLWRYEIDGIARGSSSDEAGYCATLKGTDPEPRELKGRQTAQIDPMGVRAETTYNDDGLITKEVMDPGAGNHLDLTTTYGPFDANGLPQRVVDPEGNDGEPGDGEAEHTWLYYYDAVGNLEQVVDPRGTQGLSPGTRPAPSAPFVTTLQYDQLNRLEREKTPKDSVNGVFINRRYAYDLNDNLEDSFDGENAKTHTTYTAMDRPKATTDAEGSTTEYAYDQEESLTEIVAPRGVATPGVGGDYTTRFHLDVAGRRVATEQLTTEPGEEDLLTSYAYDDRGNVIGVALPKNNSSSTKGAYATVSLDDALANAAGADQRFTYEFSDSDNLLAQVEDPQGLALRTEYAYDANDNQRLITDPRAFDSVADEEGEDFETEILYDVADQMIATIDPLEGKTSYQRRADGLINRETTPRGNATSTDSNDFTTVYGYDANGNLASRSIPYAPDQYGLSTDELQSWKVRYRRNAVGDPVAITDATGSAAGYRSDHGGGSDYSGQRAAHTFTNAFYDTGDLKSTQRPSWWQLDFSSPQHETPDPGQRYAQTDSGLAPDLAVPQGGPMLGEAPGPAAAGADMGGMAPTPADLPSGPTDFGSIDPEPLPEFLPRAGSTALGYDDEMRLEDVEDAAQKHRRLVYDDIGRITEKSWAYSPLEGGELAEDDPGADQDPDSPITHAYAYDANGNLKSFTDGEGTRPSAPSAAYEWQFGYDQFDRRQSELAPGSKESASSAPIRSLPRDLTEFEYDPNSNLAARILPRTVQGTDLAFSYGYDQVDRLSSETNPESESYSYDYDAAGNLELETSPVGNQTKIGYDEMGRQIAVTEALETTDERVTLMDYDRDGNLIETIAPGAVPEESQAIEDRVTEVTYDGRGLPWATTIAGRTTSAGSEVDRTPLRTTVQEFDPNGNLRRTVNPKGVSDRLPIVEDPGYASQSQSQASDAAQHASVGVYDADNQMAALHRPWSPDAPAAEVAGDEGAPAAYAEADSSDPTGVDQQAENARRYRQEFTYDARGRLRTLTSPVEWQELGPDEEVDAISYGYYDTDWIKSQTDPEFTEDRPGGGEKRINERTILYGYDRRGIQTLWITPTYQDKTGDPGELDDARRITREIYPSGLLAQRVGSKLDPAHPQDDPIKRRYAYFYNPSGSLVETLDTLPAEIIEATDMSPDDRERRMVIERDLAERQIRVNEDWAGGRDTVFEYFPDGTTQTRKTDGKLKLESDDCPAGQTLSCTYSGGKTTTFTYDHLLQETTMRVSGEGEDRSTDTDYYPSGDPMIKERWTGAEDQVKETYFWLPDGQMSRMRVDRPGTGDDKDQPYTYDPNGNRTTDERGTHAFNARDQLVLWRRGAEQKITPGTHVSYELNGSGSTTAQRDTGANQPDLTTFDYLGQSSRLEATETTDPELDDSRSSYTYDEFGSVREIHTELTEGGAPAPEPIEPPPTAGVCDTSDWTDGQSVYYCYDQFERLVTTQSSDPDKDGPKDPEANSYVYDGLDRRDLSIAKGGEAREHFYVGMSELLSREETDGANHDTYDYDSRGSSQGQATTEDGATTYHGYGKDANGSITELEGQDGTVADDDTYVYDPYGGLEDPDPEDETTPEEELGDDAEANPFRFQGFYYDSGVESYDMQAREYRPDVGRFLSQDRFAAAAGDLQLQSDPLTQDRYAFAGGNPVSNIEFDGHMVRREAPALKGKRARRAAKRTKRFQAQEIRESESYQGWDETSKAQLTLLANTPRNKDDVSQIYRDTTSQDSAIAAQRAAGLAGGAVDVLDTGAKTIGDGSEAVLNGISDAAKSGGDVLGESAGAVADGSKQAFEGALQAGDDAIEGLDSFYHRYICPPSSTLCEPALDPTDPEGSGQKLLGTAEGFFSAGVPFTDLKFGLADLREGLGIEVDTSDPDYVEGNIAGELFGAAKDVDDLKNLFTAPSAPPSTFPSPYNETLPEGIDP